MVIVVVAILMIFAETTNRANDQLTPDQVVSLLRSEVFRSRQDLRRRVFATPRLFETRSVTYQNGRLTREVKSLTRYSGNQLVYVNTLEHSEEPQGTRLQPDMVWGMNKRNFFRLYRKPPENVWLLYSLSPRGSDSAEDKQWWNQHSLGSLLDDGNAPRSVPKRGIIVYDTEDFDRLPDAPGFVLLDGRFGDGSHRYLEIKYRVQHPVSQDPQMPSETECWVKFDTQRAYQEVAFSRSYRTIRQPDHWVNVSITWDLEEAGGIPFCRLRRKTTLTRDSAGKEDRHVHEMHTVASFGPQDDALFSPSAFGVPDPVASADVVVPATTNVPWTLYGVAVGFALLVVCILLSRRKAAA